MSKDKVNVIKKYADPKNIRYGGPHGKTKIGKIQCPGCGMWISSDQPDHELEDVEYSVNRRGSAVVFHRECYRKAWDSKIL